MQCHLCRKVADCVKWSHLRVSRDVRLLFWRCGQNPGGRGLWCGVKITGLPISSLAAHLRLTIFPELSMAAKPRLKRNKKPIEVLTVGHSTRTTKEFETLLLAHDVKQLADVRTIPRSRHNPQFNSDRLPRSLQKVGIRYRHMVELGGLRHARRDSMNTAWRNASFRGFADYMQAPEFKTALDELIRIAQMRRTAIMCAEAVPWRCHRSLIADALLVRGIHVAEIVSGTQTRPHTLTPWARIVRKQVSYPAARIPDSNGQAISRVKTRAATAAHVHAERSRESQ
jgi:hypothetical protein